MISSASKVALILFRAALSVVLLAACTATQARPEPQSTAGPTGQPSAVALATPERGPTAGGPELATTPGAPAAPAAACAPPPIVAPTPAPDPGYTQQDPSTGLHMTGTATNLDVATYRLQVTGKVAHPLSLSFDELRCLPRVAARPRLVCPGFFVDTANWAGASLAAVLALAEPAPDARYVELVGADGYSSVPEIEKALDPANFLAYEWEGQPVPVLHGFPVRAVLPAEEGNRWVKWLVKIDVK